MLSCRDLATVDSIDRELTEMSRQESRKRDGSTEGTLIRIEGFPSLQEMPAFGKLERIIVVYGHYRACEMWCTKGLDLKHIP
jgi:hypothetical protein